ncbi:DUF433 domain-containing protein [Dolichospermum circinale]|uniref:DUF433 domain-containing protein n=1 Tax=Dolichospermum circinale TaxID=109265 RepID=UPI0003F60424
MCSGTACIANTRIPIRLLVESRRLGISEAQILDDYPRPPEWANEADLSRELDIAGNREDKTKMFLILNS